MRWPASREITPTLCADTPQIASGSPICPKVDMAGRFTRPSPAECDVGHSEHVSNDAIVRSCSLSRIGIAAMIKVLQASAHLLPTLIMIATSLISVGILTL